MTFALGMVAGVMIAVVVFVAYMGPKHWQWHEENLDLRSQLKVAVERSAHYQNLVRPNEWGPVEQHEARIVKKKPPYQGITLEPGQAIDFVFDDIRQTPEDKVAYLEAIERNTP